MADVFEQNLPSKANLTTNDYIRVVGSDNNSYKQLVSDVAKKIIENYTGSSLAGSSQSVKSALDTLNSKSTLTAWGTTISFTCPTNHRFMLLASSTAIYTGVNYPDTLSFSQIAGDNARTLTATRDGSSINITASAATNMAVFVF